MFLHRDFLVFPRGQESAFMVATGRLWICIAVSFAVVATGIFWLNDSAGVLYRYRDARRDEQSDQTLYALQNSVAYRRVLMLEAAGWLNNTNSKSDAKTAYANLLVVRNGLDRLGIVPNEKELRTYFSDWLFLWNRLPEYSASNPFPTGCFTCDDADDAKELSNDSEGSSRLRLLFRDHAKITDPDLTAAIDFLRQVDSSSSMATRSDFRVTNSCSSDSRLTGSRLTGSCSCDLRSTDSCSTDSRSIGSYATALIVFDPTGMPIHRNPLNRMMIVSQAELVAVGSCGLSMGAYSRPMSLSSFFSMLGFLSGTFGIFSRNLVQVLGFDPGRVLVEALALATKSRSVGFCSAFMDTVCRFNVTRFDSAVSPYEKNLSTVVLLI